MDLTLLVALLVVLAVVIGLARLSVKIRRNAAARVARFKQQTQEKVEAMFRATFPELQPHFHPARVHEFVKARRARAGPGSRFTWARPPGFADAATAEVEPEGARESVRLLDAAGALLAAFVFEPHDEGGVLRVGKGKFTVNLNGPEPRVRYWHPDREFKWTPTSWKFQTRMSEQPLESRSDDSSYSSDSRSSSSSSIATGAAATAGIVAAGGTFDGGGASAAWDDSGGGGSASSGADSSPDFSSVESGSSSSSSTSY